MTGAEAEQLSRRRSRQTECRAQTRPPGYVSRHSGLFARNSANVLGDRFVLLGAIFEHSRAQAARAAGAFGGPDHASPGALTIDSTRCSLRPSPPPHLVLGLSFRSHPRKPCTSPVRREAFRSRFSPLRVEVIGYLQRLPLCPTEWRWFDPRTFCTTTQHSSKRSLPPRWSPRRGGVRSGLWGLWRKGLRRRGWVDVGTGLGTGGRVLVADSGLSLSLSLRLRDLGLLVPK